MSTTESFERALSDATASICRGRNEAFLQRYSQVSTHLRSMFRLARQCEHGVRLFQFSRAQAEPFAQLQKKFAELSSNAWVDSKPERDAATAESSKFFDWQIAGARFVIFSAHHFGKVRSVYARTINSLPNRHGSDARLLTKKANELFEQAFPKLDGVRNTVAHTGEPDFQAQHGRANGFSLKTYKRTSLTPRMMVNTFIRRFRTDAMRPLTRSLISKFGR